MSIVVDSIKKRWGELCKIRRQGLTARNVDEYYERDVRDLVRMNEALLKTCCQLNIRLHEAQGVKPYEFKVYWDNFNKAVERLLVQNNPPDPNPPKPILKLDG